MTASCTASAKVASFPHSFCTASVQLPSLLHSFLHSFCTASKPPTQLLAQLPACHQVCVCLQASATRNEDEQFFGSQQALLQQQLADLRLKADQFRAEGREASNGLRKKRLKLQQDLEVHL